MISINQKPIYKFDLNFDTHSLCILDAYLAGDINVVPGQTVMVNFEDNLQSSLIFEVKRYSDAGTGRFHIVCVQQGGLLLSTLCVPTFLTNPNPATIVQSLYPAQYTITTPPVITQLNLTIPGILTNFQALARYFGDVRQTWNGLELGKPVPKPNAGKFQCENYSESTKLMNVNFPFGDIVINPGDIIFSSGVVENITYSGFMDKFYAIVRFTSDSSPTILI